MGPRSPRSNGFDGWRHDDSIGSGAHSELRQPSPNPGFGGDPNNNFVQLHSSKSAVELSAHESVGPVAIVTILFFLWGFASGLLSVSYNISLPLEDQIDTIKPTESALVGLHSAYYGGYFVGPLTFSGYIFRHYGFRITFIGGLVIYGVGCIVFWPCAVLQTYSGFIISNFISGLGVATIEVAANLFVAICGPPDFWEARLNLSQGAQAIGNVFAPILADKVIFRRDERSSNTQWLISVQWGYLGVAFFDFALALFFWYVPLPECTDAEISRVNRWRPARTSLNEKSRKRFVGKKALLLLGVWAQFCYTGAQEILSVNGPNLIATFSPEYVNKTNTYLWSAEGLLAFGRLTGGVGMFFIPARWWYLLFSAGCIATSSLILGLQYTPNNSEAIVGLRILLQFFESILFPTIFAMSLRGLSGRNVKWGASWQVLGVCGGAVWPPVYQAIRNRYSEALAGNRAAWILVIVLFCIGPGVQSMFVNFMPSWKHKLDALSKQELRERYEADGTIGGRLDGTNDHVA
ncbi:hypothetical protein H072_731 [Dactylellina haptotyla CBS 200.50]|uniref:Major facilitator superfamily (MFS) profile domain-containing protein n=1 Tax=Dactylellina haptotyla (strain CBS 200.50) TaxID=1284197 RepID=S8AQX0_DACHA|nr:hypothetical protein H072_731 [Dactylellina haptotyla CBS 200.50]